MKKTRKLKTAAKPKKKTTPKQAAPKPAPKPKWLPSQQWISESTITAAAEVGAGSNSPTEGPKPECIGKTRSPSEDLVQEPPYEASTPGEIGLPGDSWGAADWAYPPFGPTEILCDSESQTWGARAFAWKFKIQFYVGTTPKPLTDEAIANADCATLREMTQDLNALIATADPENPYGWVPPDFVRQHELVHAFLMSASAFARYGSFVASIESAAESCSKSENSATKKIAKAIGNAEKKFTAGIKADFAQNRAHQPASAFIQAMTMVVNPWLEKVWAARIAKG